MSEQNEKQDTLAVPSQPHIEHPYQITRIVPSLILSYLLSLLTNSIELAFESIEWKKKYGKIFIKI